MKQKKNVTLEDVAQLAQVSIATVSMVLNTPDSKRVSQPTKQRVVEAVRQLNYQPANYAQRMRGKGSTILGLIIPDLMNQFYPEITCGFSNAADKLGYNVILLNSRNQVDREEFFTDTLIGMRVAGAAICGANFASQQEQLREKAIVNRLMTAGIPVVRLDRYDDEDRCPCVGIDNRQASACMTQHLIDDGHRNIALFAPKQRVYIQEERCIGYCKTMEQNGLEPRIFETDQINFSDIRPTMERMLADPCGFTALFNAASDMGAIECIKCAAQLGMRVPDDLSIAGFDDIYLANIVNPSLTTIFQPKYEIGKIAMQMLACMIDSEKMEEKSVMLPFEYIKRDSTRTLK